MDAMRFWAKVEKADGCWLWRGSLRANGYGRYGRSGEGTHRIAWVLTNGPIRDSLWVLHCCDNPPCVNPAHLFLGTHQDNMTDRNAKGRQMRGDRHTSRTHPERLARGEMHPSRRGSGYLPRGEQQHLAKLTQESVTAIRTSRAEGVAPKVLAAKYGVSTAAIWLIVTRKTWKHVP